MSVTLASFEDPEILAEFFQGFDDDENWLSGPPDFEWTAEDLAEFEHERRCLENEVHAWAAWWESEGVRCATFGRDPELNPYLELVRPKRIRLRKNLTFVSDDFRCLVGAGEVGEWFAHSSCYVFNGRDGWCPFFEWSELKADFSAWESMA